MSMITRELWKILSLLTSSAVLLGCGMALDSDITPREYSLDGVKLIGADVDPMSEDSHTQDRYSLNPERRLLLRFEKLLERAKRVRTDSGNEVIFRVYTVGSAEMIRGAVRVCPVTRNWMMRASWLRAHPNTGGRWASHGGDLDEEGCVAPEAKAQGDLENQLNFRLTRWFLDYLIARGVNYGFALVADQEVIIRGDKSGSWSPRMSWKETASFEPYSP
jgi:hypothetical protein